MSLLKELKRRNVIRVAMAYVVVAWLIIQVVETILPAFGYSDFVLRIVVIVLAIAFIPTLAFSWVFEFTPEGLKREVDVVREHSITRFTGKRLDRIIMLLLAVALGYFAFDKFVLDPIENVQIAESAHQDGRSEALVESYGDKSIAVLPFVNMSSDPEQEYFSDGISEELLNLMSKIPNLRVISRSSAFRFKGKDIEIPSVARQLNVTHVLEGSVRTTGNQVRITAQLIEGRSDTDLWSETYDGELTASNVFAIQAQIAEKISRALDAVLAKEDRVRLNQVPTQNLQAYEAYMLGKQRMVMRTREKLLEASDYFNKAVELDPQYASAWVGLADAILLLSNYGYLPQVEALARAETSLAKALAIDDKLGAAYASMGLLRVQQGDNAGAESAFKRAIELDSNIPQPYHWYGDLLVSATGQPEAAIPLLERARALDPLSPIINVTLGQALEASGKFSEASIYYNKAKEIEPDFPPAYYLIAQHFRTVFGEMDEAVRWHHKELALEATRDNGSLGLIYLELGDRQEAEFLIDRAQGRQPLWFLPNAAKAFLLRYSGDEAQALQHARRMLAIFPGNNISLLTFVTYGQYKEALETVAPLYPELGCNVEPIVNRTNLFQAINLSLALQETGEQECANRLLDKSLEQMQEMPRRGLGGYGIADVEIYARKGEKQHAISTLRRVIDEGFSMSWWWQLTGPHMALLFEDPEFNVLMEEIKAERVNQLAHVQEMEANGELEPIPE
jgi:TolB-like protein/Tfp pilus assembly protein PilF